jgi:ATP-binding cassette, subfamily F, member 3
MTVLILKKITKAFQGRPVLKEIDLTLRKGEKVGFVGRNGCGKTTLLEIIAGSVEADSGSRQVSGTPSIGIITQEAGFRQGEVPATILQVASEGQARIRELEREMARIAERIDGAGADSRDDGNADLDRLVHRQSDVEEEYRLLGGYLGQARAESVLSGLGFPENRFSSHPSTLSGGETKRLQIARLLLGGHSLLLLDEPGNHLDINGCEWLTRYLKEYSGSLVLVSHDRYLLNAVSDRVVEIENGRTRSFKGNLDAFMRHRAEALETERKAREQQKRLVEKEEELIRRIHYGQKARQAKSRQKRLDRIEPLEEIRTDRKMKFRFTEERASGEIVLDLEGVAGAAGGKTLFEDFDLILERGKTLGIIGPNGSGKSTLLKIILGRVAPAAGKIDLKKNVAPAYFDQNLEELDGSGTVLDELRLEIPTATDRELRGHIARFLITGDDVDKQVVDLSGGEKSRVLLARLILRKANLLVLDEPTNHLDIYTREALDQALRFFSGTIIMVTHDRRLLDRTVDEVLVLDGPRTRLHLGNYSKLMEETAAAAETERRDAAGAKKKKRARTKETRPDRVKRRFTFDDLEDLIMRKEDRATEIKAALYTEEVYSDKQRFLALEEEARSLETELKELYHEWDTWAK